MWQRVVFHALWLNALWETAQCQLLYDMDAQPWMMRLGWMAVATLGDVTIVILVWRVARGLYPSQRVPLTLLVILGLTAGFTLEWMARALGWWTYTPLMPILLVGGETIGISPIVQMSLLPAFSVALAARNAGRNKAA